MSDQRSPRMGIRVPRGKCPRCGYSWRLRKDGTLQRHRLYVGVSEWVYCDEAWFLDPETAKTPANTVRARLGHTGEQGLQCPNLAPQRLCVYEVDRCQKIEGHKGLCKVSPDGVHSFSWDASIHPRRTRTGDGSAQ